MRAISTLLLLVLSCALLLACGGKDGPKGIERVNKDTLVNIVTADEPETLDLHNTDNGADVKIISQIYESLLRVDPNDINTLIPDLAESWKVAGDGLSIALTIRTGVKFHDGTALDAAAAKKSLDRLCGFYHTVPNAPTRPYFQSIAGIEAKDMTLTVKLKSPCARVALRNLAMYPAGIVSPKLLGDTEKMEAKEASEYISKHACGTGAFKLESFDTANHQVRLTAFDSWRGGKPKVETLLFKSVADPNSRFEYFKAGKAHVVDDLLRPHWSEVEKIQGARLHSWWALNLCYLGINAKHPKTSDINVRRAIQLAIERSELEKLYDGTARATYSLIAQPFGEYDATYRAPATESDLAARQAQARGLIEKAGAMGRELTIYYPMNERPYLPTPDKVADKVRQQLEAIGLKVNITKVPNGELFDSIKKDNYELVLIGWMSDNGDADNFYGPLADGDEATKTAGTSNCSRVFDPAVHQALVAAQSIGDMAQRVKAYRDIEKKLQTEIAGYAPLLNAKQAVAFSAAIDGVEVDPLGTYRFHKAALR